MPKTLHCLLLLILPTILFSCSKDEDQFIVGQWRLTALYEFGEEMELMECDAYRVFEFGSDGSYRSFIQDGAFPELVCGFTAIDRFNWEESDIADYQVRFPPSFVRLTTYTIVGDQLEARYYPGSFSAILTRL